MIEKQISLSAGAKTQGDLKINDTILINIVPNVWERMRWHGKWLLIANMDLRCFKFQEILGRTVATPGNAIDPLWHHRIQWWGRILFWKTDKTVAKLWMHSVTPLVAPTVLEIRLEVDNHGTS